jgi:hypothetical protein
MHQEDTHETAPEQPGPAHNGERDRKAQGNGGERLLQQMGSTDGRGSPRTPILALTRRGDLKAKLVAFD